MLRRLSVLVVAALLVSGCSSGEGGTGVSAAPSPGESSPIVAVSTTPPAGDFGNSTVTLLSEEKSCQVTVPSPFWTEDSVAGIMARSDGEGMIQIESFGSFVQQKSFTIDEWISAQRGLYGAGLKLQVSEQTSTSARIDFVGERYDAKLKKRVPSHGTWVARQFAAEDLLHNTGRMVCSIFVETSDSVGFTHEPSVQVLSRTIDIPAEIQKTHPLREK